MSVTTHQASPKAPTQATRREPLAPHVTMTLKGHKDRVHDVAFIRGTRLLVTGSADKSLRVWDLDTGKQVGEPLLGYSAQVLSVAASPDGHWIVSGRGNGSILVWEVATDKTDLKRAPVSFEGHKWGISGVVFAPDSETFASASWDKTVCVWKRETGKIVLGPLKVGSGANSVSYSPDGMKLAAGTMEHIIVWNTKTGEELLKIERRAFRVTFTPDGLRLVSTSGYERDIQFSDATTGDIRISDATTGEIIKQFKAHTYDLTSLAMAPNGTKFATTSRDNTTRFFDLTTFERIGKPLEFYRVWFIPFPECVAFSEDSQLIATGCADGLVRTWTVPLSDLEKESQQFDPHSPPGRNNRAAATTRHAEGSKIKNMMNRLFSRSSAPQGHAPRIPLSKDTLREDTSKGQVADNILAVNTTAREACITGDLVTADRLLSREINTDSNDYNSYANRSFVMARKADWDRALDDALKVIKRTPSSHIGYQLQHAALHGAQRYDEAIDAFQTMLSKLENAPDTQTRKLRQQYINPSEAERAIQETIKAQLDDAPHRLLNTFTGRLCDGEGQINAFKTSTEYKELLSSTLVHADLRMERIQDVVATYFRCVTLSHRWEGKEPLLHDIQDKVVHELNPVGGIVKLQSFCKTVRAAGYRWGWIDTCCIDQTNNVELQKSLNSMFVWYRTSALTMVYLSDVPPSSKPGALARSAWDTRGWTVPEFLAPKVIRFYQNDWTPYLNDRSPNHKQSVAIMQELEYSTGIDAKILVAFSPGMVNAREKLQWVSARVTTVQEDIAYSLFGIFGVHLPVMYGEKKQNALGRLLQEVVARSGDISALDWVGQSSEFNSCLPAGITSYTAPPYTPPFLSEGDIQTSISLLRQIVAVNLALKLYALLDNLNAPRFANCRLQLHCIAFRVTAVTQRPVEHKGTYFTYEVKADGLRDLQITTEDRLLQFSRERPARQPFLLVRPWDRRLLELPDYADDTDDLTLPGSPEGEGPVDPESSERAMRLIVRLGQPFSAFLLAQQRSGEYKRIASDHDIITQVRDVDYVHGMDIRTLEML
ncbi:hypothetical protein BDR05DRAFT_1063445 [Suillus weaverae]|nr:hypothetical protein BDR05DRAFT_1063445 [Suillus weaverae]